MDDKKIGAALVLGGGIAGMQAALDLAEAGIKVYLVDTKPSIGGVMSQLDKTFPTNDCAMCTMGPRLVEIARHKDIEIITQADLEKIEGNVGHFKVSLKKRPRYVIEEKCTGCGECETVCPVSLPNEFNLSLNQRKAIYRLYPQAVPNAFAVDKAKEKSPCRLACPAGCDNQAYIALISQGRFKEAIEVIRRRIPIPSICGRICHAPCEDRCNRREVDEAIAIRALKRFAADYERLNNKDKEIKPFEVKFPEKIAIIGSGPAGLTCAYDLASRGYQTTIFELLPVIGGMLRVGIPQYRLPSEIIDYEIEQIKKRGVEILTNTPLGPDLTLKDIFAKGYKAIFIAIGMHQSKRLGIEGEDLRGVVHGAPFLDGVNRGHKVDVKGKVVAVIGGGKVALDSGRTALRLEAKDVFIIYRRSRTEMLVSEGEIQEAEKEGIKIYYLTSPSKILGKEGKVYALELRPMKLTEPDETGRRQSIPDKSKHKLIIKVDLVIPAIGQEPDFTLLGEDVVGGDGLMTERGFLKVDETTLATNIPGIFAGGDVVGLSAFAIDAIAHGHIAAESIHRYLRGLNLDEGREKERQDGAKIPPRKIESQKRVILPKLPPKERIKSFAEVELGYLKEEAVSEAKRCLNCGLCSECLLCVESCKIGAIDHQMPKESDLELNVGAIILAPGYELFDAKKKDEYGYSRYQNVLTALEFERILSSSGPFKGEILRPSHKKPPQKIAFIQCVGSRDYERDYCSAVCCMYATKEAIIAKEHLGSNLQCDIFFMDIRAFSKGFEQYYERAKKAGINYIRCRIPSISEIPETKNLVVEYLTEDDRKTSSEYDLVVLSVGIQPPKEVKKISRRLGINLNKFNFCETSLFGGVETTHAGIYAAGSFTEPKDIPETVMQASAAALKVQSLLKEVKGTLIKVKEYPEERDVKTEKPRIGVFVCSCGTNIAGVINVSELVLYAETLSNVVFSQNSLYVCSQDACENIKKMIEEHSLNRVVVASCTPRTHEPLFRSVLKEAGLNPYLFEMANIRDQCSWVHRNEPEKALKKAKDLVRMAVAKARLLEPLYQGSMPLVKSALIIGGGLSGMVSALAIAEQDIDVYLVEKENQLGGLVRRIHYLLNGEDPQEKLIAFIERIKTNKKIHLFTSAKIESVEGSMGHFKTKITTNSGSPYEIEHGVVIVATGAKEYVPKEYLYGQETRVITQLELEEKLVSHQLKTQKLKTVVMIQCVGSRDNERPSCSRVCCPEAIKNALKIIETRPDINVYILYRDIRTYGFRETYYTKAREKGVVFVRYEEDKKPEVLRDNDKLKVRVFDQILKIQLVIEAELVVLSTGTVAEETNKTVSQYLKVPLNQEGFFLEAHMKLRPVDFATEGVFLCGLAHSSKSIEESIIQALAAAGRASLILSKDKIALDAHLSYVVDENCDGCAYCVDPCPYKAITLIEYIQRGAIKKTVEVQESLCKGCGTCMATCPKKGIFVKGFRLEQIAAQIEAALQGV